MSGPRIRTRTVDVLTAMIVALDVALVLVLVALAVTR